MSLAGPEVLNCKDTRARLHAETDNSVRLSTFQAHLLDAVDEHGYGDELRGWQLLARDLESVFMHDGDLVLAMQARATADLLSSRIRYASRSGRSIRNGAWREVPATKEETPA